MNIKTFKNNHNGFADHNEATQNKNASHNLKTEIINKTIKRNSQNMQTKNNFNKRSSQKQNSRSGSFGTQTKRRNTAVAQKKKPVIIPDLAKGNFRVIPLGGVEEVGRNMYAFEYGNDILIVDAGFQFVNEEDSPGIDYILPNTKYLEERKDKIRGLIITHGHLDHIGGIPYMIERLGNPPIYTMELTSLLIKKRQTEFPDLPEIDYKIVKPNERISFNDLSVKFFSVTHSIPDSMGIVFESPEGNVIITGDLKLEHVDGVAVKKEEDIWSELGKEKNILFIADSTNAEQPGFSITEQVIQKNLEQIIKTAPERLIIGTFASQFQRMIKIIEICEKYNKKVITDGRSIKTNIEVAKKAGLLKMQTNTLVSISEIDNYPPDSIVVIATGAQGEEFATLSRITRKQHKYIRLTERDTIILSSSVVPGNELSVRKLKDNLCRHGVKIITYKTSDVHSTGHATQEELAWFIKKINPKFFMPAFGYHSMLREHAEVARRVGMQKKDIIIPDNGMVIETSENGSKINVLKERAPSEMIVVDGLSVGGVQEVVLRDRQMLAQDGIFVIIAIIDMRTRQLRKSPDIISRGFVYLRESQDLLRQARYITKKSIENMSKNSTPIDFDSIKKRVTNDVEKYLLQQTAKRPIVLPVLLGI